MSKRKLMRNARKAKKGRASGENEGKRKNEEKADCGKSDNG